MHRTAFTALASAAVIGLASGVGAGLWQSRGSDAPSSAPTGPTPSAPASGSATPSPTAAPVETERPLLYATAAEVHDGDRTIAHDLGELPFTLTRADGAYVLGRGTADDTTSREELIRLDPDGTTATIARVVGDWDLDADRTRLAGVDAETSRVMVWDLDGQVITEGEKVVDERSSVVFAGDDILVSEYRPSAEAALLTRVDPETGATRRETPIIPAKWGASPDGSVLAGSVDSERASRPQGATCLLGGLTPLRGDTWITCDWRRQRYWRGPEFSPDGQHLLAIPAESDGFGPGQFGILDAERGADSLTRVDAPEWTREATFAGSESLYVLGDSDGELSPDTDTVLYRCGPDSCEELERLADTPAVLGVDR